jgi:Zn-dependent membrane protease YugP
MLSGNSELVIFLRQLSHKNDVFMNSIFLVSLIFVGISMLVSYRLKSKFSEYSRVVLSSGLNGKQVAEKMLRENGIMDVKVVSGHGYLSDHYNPLDKTVNLSPEVYSGVSVAAAAVAAHECGHAVQHAKAYPWLTMRSKLVPVVQFSSGLIQWVLLAGILMINVFPQLLLAGIILFAVTTLFSFITLPVEFDASNRALAWLNKTGITSARENPLAKDALKWAALTYVVAAIASLVTLIQYIFIFLGNRDRN